MRTPRNFSPTSLVSRAMTRMSPTLTPVPAVVPPDGAVNSRTSPGSTKFFIASSPCVYTLRRGLRAGVLPEPAEVNGLGCDVVGDLDLHAIHVEPDAAVDAGSALALERGQNDDVDLVGTRGQIPGRGAVGVQPRLRDDRELPGE